ncbi:MAG TPA: hypothetical protein VHC22_08950 [Pirellulales bacterium]|nr:hypothetical protein [Pirellulales bacterium]
MSDLKFRCRLSQSGGRWQARHESPELGEVSVSGASRDEVLDKLRGELRYRLELCPCTGESYQHLQVEVVEG